MFWSKWVVILWCRFAFTCHVVLGIVLTVLVIVFFLIRINRESKR